MKLTRVRIFALKPKVRFILALTILLGPVPGLFYGYQEPFVVAMFLISAFALGLLVAPDMTGILDSAPAMRSIEDRVSVADISNIMKSLRKCGFPAIATQHKIHIIGDKYTSGNAEVNSWFLKLAVLVLRMDIDTFTEEEYKKLGQYMPVNFPGLIPNDFKDWGDINIEALNKILPIAEELRKNIALNTNEWEKSRS